MEHGEERALLIMPSPYYESLFESVRRKPKSKLYFITIKDNSQSTKWITIGKVNDWVRKYADEYIITRGKVGGLHFHLVCYANKNTNFKIPKGIHARISQVAKKKSVEPPSPEDIQDVLKAKHLKKKKKKKLCKKLKIPEVCQLISAMILSYFERLKNRTKRLEAKNYYEENIVRVLDYLQKNLLENSPTEQLQYLSWIDKSQ